MKLIKIVSYSTKILFCIYTFTLIGNFIFTILGARDHNIENIIFGLFGETANFLISLLQALFFLAFVIVLDIVAKDEK